MPKLGEVPASSFSLYEVQVNMCTDVAQIAVASPYKDAYDIPIGIPELL